MIRWMVWTLAGLLIGVLAHLISVVVLPRLSTQTGFQRAAAVAGTNGFNVFQADKTPLPLPDPEMISAFCRYNLVDGPIKLTVPVGADFLAISFYTSAGLNYYALTDRAAANGVIDLNLYTPAQLAQVRAKEGPDQPGSPRLQAASERGIVVLRALIPEPGEGAQIQLALSSAHCGPA